MAEERRWDAENPLGRIKAESAKANDALRDYYYMGSNRSYAKLHVKYLEQSQQEAIDPPTKRRYAIDTWGHKNQWVERVAAQKAIDDAEREALWAARRLEVQEQDWLMAGKLRDVAAKILDEAPLFVKQQRRLIKGEEGQPDQLLITMALNGQLAVQAAQAASKLSRLAAEMESERHKIVLALEKEVETFFDAAQDVLDGPDFERLLVRLGGGTSGEKTAEENTELAGDEEEQSSFVAPVAGPAGDGI